MNKLIHNLAKLADSFDSKGLYAEANEVDGIIKDDKEYKELAKKHIPIIEKSADKVTVRVGEELHPMEADHYIMWVELLEAGKVLVKKDLTPNDKPIVTFEGKFGDNIAARIECNVHGIWQSKS